MLISYPNFFLQFFWAIKENGIVYLFKAAVHHILQRNNHRGNDCILATSLTLNDLLFIRMYVIMAVHLQYEQQQRCETPLPFTTWKHLKWISIWMFDCLWQLSIIQSFAIVPLVNCNLINLTLSLLVPTICCVTNSKPFLIFICFNDILLSVLHIQLRLGVPCPFLMASNLKTNL